VQSQQLSLHDEVQFLRAENADLRRQLAERDAQIAERDARIAALEARVIELEALVAKLSKMVFGKSSEKRSEKMPRPYKEIEEQDRIKLDPEVIKKKRKARDEVRKQNATQVQINHVLEEAKRRCPTCKDQLLKSAGTKESVVDEFVPAHFERQIHVQETWACPCCDHIVTAEGPKRPTEGGQYGPGFMSHVVVSKCADSIPFYRMAKQFNRIGIPMSRSTLCDLFHQAATILEPLYQFMQVLVMSSMLVLADETPLHVLDKKLDRTRKGYIWVFLTDLVAYYRFSPNRSGETPCEVLGSSEGTLMADGFSGYNKVTDPEGRERAGCMAHARRKFFEALQTAPKEAQYMLDQILLLYRVEYEAAKKDIVGKPIHTQLRQTQAGPILEHMKTWVEQQQPLHLPRSPMGQAITYMLNQWSPLTHYLTDGKIPIDNNLSERRLRLIALGRKNYLFVGHDIAAQNLAVLQSLVVTCDMHGVNSEVYLKDVLIRVQTHPNKDIGDLLPHRWKELFAPQIPNSTFEL
jgi:transposase